eukprot:scaffold106555_cov53-Attheya_sp.AAC.1
MKLANSLNMTDSKSPKAWRIVELFVISFAFSFVALPIFAFGKNSYASSIRTATINEDPPSFFTVDDQVEGSLETKHHRSMIHHRPYRTFSNGDLEMEDGQLWMQIKHKDKPRTLVEDFDMGRHLQEFSQNTPPSPSTHAPSTPTPSHMYIGDSSVHISSTPSSLLPLSHAPYNRADPTVKKSIHDYFVRKGTGIQHLVSGIDRSAPIIVLAGKSNGILVINNSLMIDTNCYDLSIEETEVVTVVYSNLNNRTNQTVSITVARLEAPAKSKTITALIAFLNESVQTFDVLNRTTNIGNDSTLKKSRLLNGDGSGISIYTNGSLLVNSSHNDLGPEKTSDIAYLLTTEDTNGVVTDSIIIIRLHRPMSLDPSNVIVWEDTGIIGVDLLSTVRGGISTNDVLLLLGNDEGIAFFGNGTMIINTNFYELEAGENETVIFVVSIVTQDGLGGSSISKETTRVTILGKTDQPTAQPIEFSVFTHSGNHILDLLPTILGQPLGQRIRDTELIDGNVGGMTYGNGTLEVDSDFYALSHGDTEIIIFNITVEADNGHISSFLAFCTLIGKTDVPVAQPIELSIFENSGKYILNLLSTVVWDEESENASMMQTLNLVGGDTEGITMVNISTLQVDADLYALSDGEIETIAYQATAANRNGDISNFTVIIKIIGVNDVNASRPVELSVSKKSGRYTLDLFSGLSNRSEQKITKLELLHGNAGGVTMINASALEVNSDFYAFLDAANETCVYEVTVENNDGEVTPFRVTITIVADSQHPFSQSVDTSIPLVVPSPSFHCGQSSLDRSDTIFAILSAVSDPLMLRDKTSTESKAIHWLINEDELVVCPQSEKQIIQRYVLALIYYSTSGDNWSKCSAGNLTDNCGNEKPFVGQVRFLGPENECEWAGIRCDDTYSIIEILFEANNLVGTIPGEIGELTDLERWGMERGGLTGTIPTSIERLSNLYFLDLYSNQISGTLSTELLSLLNLNYLDLHNNVLSGPVGGIGGSFPQLLLAQLHSNLFTGTIPESMAVSSGLGTSFGLYASRYATTGLSDSSVPVFCFVTLF